MKLFWIGYLPLPAGFFIFVLPMMGNALIEASFVVGVICSVTFLISRSDQVLGKKHQVFLGLLAGFSSIAVGFAIVLAMILFGEIWDHLPRGN